VTNEWDAVMALVYGFVGIVVLIVLVGALLLIIPTWRILQRAGFSGALSLLHLLPVVGTFVVLAILAFATWPAGEAPPRPRSPT